MSGERGVTLIELVTVLSIMLVLFGLALPTLYEWRASAGYRSAARMIVNALRLARDHAISRSREVEVDFDLERNCYRMRSGNQSYASDSWEELTAWTELPRGIALAATKDCDKRGDNDLATLDVATFQFNPNGTCGTLGNMRANYICVMTEDLKPRYAGAVLSYSTGRAVVKTWNSQHDDWE